MSRLGMATSVAACLPHGALEQILEIWEARASRHVEMEFKDGRCLEIKITKSRRFNKEDFNDKQTTTTSEES